MNQLYSALENETYYNYQKEPSKSQVTEVRCQVPSIRYKTKHNSRDLYVVKSIGGEDRCEEN